MNNLPPELRDEMRSYLLLAHSASHEHGEALDFFPPVLRSRVSRILNLPLLLTIDLLAGCHDAFVDALACGVVRITTLSPHFCFFSFTCLTRRHTTPFPSTLPSGLSCSCPTWI